MSIADEATHWAAPLAASSPPPSTTPTAAPSPVARITPDAAVRARLNAAVLDVILITLVVSGLRAAFGTATFSGDAVLLLLGLQFLYFFVLEAKTGQTIGKRVMNVRVIGLDGSPVTLRRSALRNLLRFVDAFPLLYASGLISILRTGRHRRQRIGDVAAGTTVVLGTGARQLRTPRWLLPVAALLTAALSVAVFVALLRAQARTHVTIPHAAAGFTGDTGQAPAVGIWAASGTVTAAEHDYGIETVGDQLFRQWRIVHACPPGSCGFWLTRQIDGGPPLTARLIPAPDGWHATFPDVILACGELDGQTVSWRKHSTWVLQFSNHGTSAVAHELNVYDGPTCGSGTDSLTWSAGLSRMP